MSTGRKTTAGSAEAKLEAELARIQGMTYVQLKSVWREHFGGTPPIKRSRDVLMRLIAWRLQERVYGGLDEETRRRLERLGQAFSRNAAHKPKSSVMLKAGTELTREWKGARHIVRVQDDGYTYDGQRYASLSEVARRITGSRWSGPLFFGLNGSGTARP